MREEVFEARRLTSEFGGWHRLTSRGEAGPIASDSEAIREAPRF